MHANLRRSRFWTNVQVTQGKRNMTEKNQKKDPTLKDQVTESQKPTIIVLRKGKDLSDPGVFRADCITHCK